MANDTPTKPTREQNKNTLKATGDKIVAAAGNEPKKRKRTRKKPGRKKTDKKIVAAYLDRVKIRIFPDEYDQDKSPWSGEEYVADAEIIGESEADYCPAAELHITDVGYTDDGRVVQYLSNGSVRILDPYSEDIELFEIWQEMPDEG